ncbi:hypothetical protein [Micromonospora vulcania]|uniref:PQQ-like domain-containing protein n=1 Tax=Micromonospora vulcania TaxID=1441873 RepID=A0ABW1H3G8_9ACTN
MRDTLSHQVAVARPLSADPAGQAIRRAMRIRRRRAAAGLALAVTATVLISTGMAQLGDDPSRQGPPTVVIGDPALSPRPIPTATIAPAPAQGTSVDLLVDSTLVSSTGGRLELPGVGPAERAFRLPDNAGWLVVGVQTTAGRSLWVAHQDGLVQVLLAGAGPIVVAPDRRQIAWRDGSDIVVAGVINAQLIGPVRTPAPAGAVPVQFVRDSVLVRLDPTRAGHALWRPGAGQLGIGTDRKTLNVYGTLPDGKLIGQVAAGDPRETCLAVLEPKQDLKPVRTGCGPDLSPDGAGGISADGRWLLVNGRVGKAERALLIDLHRLGADLTALPAGLPLTGAVAWTTDSDATYVDRAGELVRVDVDQVRAGRPAEPAPVTGVRPRDRLVVVTGS